MAWVKEDPVLETDLEDDADVMRKVLSLSVVYWMDINLCNIVDLREIAPLEKPDDLGIDYTVENLQDVEALRKQIDACMRNHGEAEREVAFKKIRAEQLTCERSLPEGVGVRWLTNKKTYFVSGMMDPIILQYGKRQLTGFLVDPVGILDVVSSYLRVNTSIRKVWLLSTFVTDTSNTSKPHVSS
ncbi:fatty acyl-coa reductase 2 [Phtheirospermum japonicum]|uniref:Fatty acyl-coa reductase 2 n=1 Tax=Phtheirospermum japonicum TaxID=374723 RepID=A0A830D1E4_9LAMI|nr:fatty acyl-coa reductase 2 [Phtheirospermum japonicum]